MVWIAKTVLSALAFYVIWNSHMLLALIFPSSLKEDDKSLLTLIGGCISILFLSTIQEHMQHVVHS